MIINNKKDKQGRKEEDANSPVSETTFIGSKETYSTLWLDFSPSFGTFSDTSLENGRFTEISGR